LCIDVVLGPSVDWWALGIILFELLTGIPPFNDDTADRVFENILTGAIPWPASGISDEAKDLISKLLTVNPSLRLGSNGMWLCVIHCGLSNVCRIERSDGASVFQEY